MSFEGQKIPTRVKKRLEEPCLVGPGCGMRGVGGRELDTRMARGTAGALHRRGCSPNEQEGLLGQFLLPRERQVRHGLRQKIGKGQ
jgi:hypothetical protein